MRPKATAPAGPTTTSASLEASPTWQRMSAEIAADIRHGLHFSQSFQMNVAIKQRDLAPYHAHREKLDAILWHDDPAPKTIIDLGAGYGAMANVWPEGSRIFNIDLPEMLDVQRNYVPTVEGTQFASLDLVPITEADRVPIDGSYLFAAWSLTETTAATWEYWIERAPRLAGAYIVGFKSWVDAPEPWPWERLAAAFKTVRVFGEVENGLQLLAVNR